MKSWKIQINIEIPYENAPIQKNPKVDVGVWTSEDN